MEKLISSVLAKEDSLGHWKKLLGLWVVVGSDRWWERSVGIIDE